jgi:hypothetical protein
VKWFLPKGHSLVITLKLLESSFHAREMFFPKRLMVVNRQILKPSFSFEWPYRIPKTRKKGRHHARFKFEETNNHKSWAARHSPVLHVTPTYRPDQYPWHLHTEAGEIRQAKYESTGANDVQFNQQ